VTVARYYTPSGRLIQTEYEDGDRQDYYASKSTIRLQDGASSAADILQGAPDSLKYRTDSGRLVIAGGGILPDYLLPSDSLSTLMQSVLSRSLETEFVRSWIDTHASEVHDRWELDRSGFIADFVVGDDMMSSFLDFAATRGVVVGDRLSEVDDDGTVRFSEDDLATDFAFLKTILKARLAYRIFDRSAFYPVYQAADKDLKEALQLWVHAQELASQYAQLK
jgi:carboxyl-terminal processing protease